jgi:hypothetical protein
MANSEGLLKVVDILNMYGLILIGLALFTGIFIRLAAAAGSVLLALYYFAYPPFGDSLLSFSEGHLFIVDKNFIECMALLFILFFREESCIIAVAWAHGMVVGRQQQKIWCGRNGRSYHTVEPGCPG